MTHLTPEQLEQFKNKLIAEKARLEEGLEPIANQNPADAGDWSAKSDEGEGDSADKNDVADAMEDFEENIAIATPLEAQLKDVEDALTRIEAGTYGLDENNGEPIPLERLEANPSARTNI
ncbi:MAG: hypothetical protein KBD16_00450 [Candidatus Pacebacteria bacterium]|nr:hypothetical protein [Candidatus Paceibacterota bacterium]